MLNHDFEEVCYHVNCQSIFTFNTIRLLKRGNEVVFEVLILHQYSDIVEVLQQTALNFNGPTHLQAGLLLLLLFKCVLSLVLSLRGCSSHEQTRVGRWFAAESSIVRTSEGIKDRHCAAAKVSTWWSVILILVRQQSYFLLFVLLLKLLGRLMAVRWCLLLLLFLFLLLLHGHSV